MLRGVVGRGYRLSLDGVSYYERSVRVRQLLANATAAQREELSDVRRLCSLAAFSCQGSLGPLTGHGAVPAEGEIQAADALLS